MNMIPARAVAAALYVFLLLSVAQANQVAAPPLELFIQAASNDDRVARTALDQIARQWRDGYVPMFIDMARLMRRAPPPGRRRTWRAAGDRR